MPARTSFVLLLAALCCAAPLCAQDEAGAPVRKGKTADYLPASRMFSCDLPTKGWYAFEEEDVLGPVVHVLGPDNPSGTYRAGLSVRWFDKSQASYVEPKKAVELMRKSDRSVQRKATGVSPMRVEGLLARLFEVFETRALPLDRLPARDEVLHRYVAVIPSGSNYYLVTLSSTRDVYLDYKDVYMRCLKTFHPLGH